MKKMQIATLLAFTSFGVILLVDRHLTQKSFEKRIDSYTKSQEQMNETMEELQKTQRALTLQLEREGYKKCNGDYECQKLYPHAFAEIEAEEALEHEALKKKSSYKE
ncbi:MAG: hypothetical protein EOP06_01050 [Proteobacteria bacterium]|nr:MAG: hypothetical protein EOP06_01050 [Pseudomonadota bacterium]